MVDKYLFYALCLAAIVYLKSVSISDFALLSLDSKQSRTSSYCRFTKPHDNLPVERQFKINCAAIARVSFHTVGFRDVLSPANFTKFACDAKIQRNLEFASQSQFLNRIIFAKCKKFALCEFEFSHANFCDMRFFA